MKLVVVWKFPRFIFSVWVLVLDSDYYSLRTSPHFCWSALWHSVTNRPWITFGWKSLYSLCSFLLIATHVNFGHRNFVLPPFWQWNQSSSWFLVSVPGLCWWEKWVLQQFNFGMFFWLTQVRLKTLKRSDVTSSTNLHILLVDCGHQYTKFICSFFP